MRNKQFFSDAKKAQKSNRETFRLSSWMASNMEAFAFECPDEATVAEAHRWWEDKAHQTLDAQLASDVSAVLASGALMTNLTDNSQDIKGFMAITASLVGLRL